MEITHRDSLNEGGFAGVREYRVVTDAQLFGRTAPGKPGLGHFVYLADAQFIPQGETGMHPHHEVDVITAMIKGRIAHGGSMSDGEVIEAPTVQVQRAGGDGFSHNEMNPDDEWNRLIQLWVLPDQLGQPANYQLFHPLNRKVTRIYGGTCAEAGVLAARTVIDVALLRARQKVAFEGPTLAYLAVGAGKAGGQDLREGHLVRAEGLSFTASSATHLIAVTLAGE